MEIHDSMSGSDFSIINRSYFAEAIQANGEIFGWRICQVASLLNYQALLSILRPRTMRNILLVYGSNIYQKLFYGTLFPTGHRPMPLRAPTWSWASLDGQVVYEGIPPTYNEPDQVRVLDVQVVNTEGVSGQCQGGVMYIECVGLLEMTGCIEGRITTRTSGESTGAEQWHGMCKFDEEHPQDRAFLLKIHSNRFSELGLIITPVSDDGGSYSRSGFYKLFLKGASAQSLKRKRASSEVELVLYEKKSRKPQRGEQMYVIKLV